MEYGNGEKNQLIWKNIDNKYHNEHFDADENTVSYDKLTSVDQYMLVKFNHFLAQMRKDFDQYDTNREGS